jgi:hypothetical protein
MVRLRIQDQPAQTVRAAARQRVVVRNTRPAVAHRASDAGRLTLRVRSSAVAQTSVGPRLSIRPKRVTLLITSPGAFPISQGKLKDLVFGPGGVLSGDQSNVAVSYDAANKEVDYSLADLSGFDTGDLAEGDPLYNQISHEDPATLSQHDDRTDIGAVKGSNPLGYYETKITDKRLHHCVIGANQRTEDGAVRVNGGDFEVYLGGRWRVLLAGVALSQREADHVLLFDPTDSAVTIETHSGDSMETGTNGRPLIQSYQASMGSNPPKEVLSGGTF